MLRKTRHDLLLIAADWQSRTLTLAELQEAGYEVMAVPGLRYGIKALIERLVMPPLILADTHADDATPERVEGLLELVPNIPLILVISAYDRPIWEPLRPRLAALLHRPVTVGEIVSAVRRAWLRQDQGRETGHE